MNTIELTNEQCQALLAEGSKPLNLVDPATMQRYVLIAQAQYARVQELLEEESMADLIAETRAQMAPQMLRSQEAFWRDLPELLKLKSKKRQCVAYHGDERVGFGKTQTELYQDCFRRGLQDGDFYVGKLEADPEGLPPWHPGESDWSLYEVSEPGEEDDLPDSI